MKEPHILGQPKGDMSLEAAALLHPDNGQPTMETIPFSYLGSVCSQVHAV